MYKKIWADIVDAKHILLVSHVNPDGDALGSILALYSVLKGLKKRVSLYNPTKELPKSFDFLPNIDKIKDKIPSFFDLVISCDCASFDRLGIDKGRYKLINLDHHSSNEMFGNLNLVDTKCASSGMVIYDLLERNGIKISMDCARCLYVSIVEDTGFFSYSDLSERTFVVVAKLVSCGVDAKEIATLLRSRVSLAKTRLLGYVFSNFNLYFDARVSFIYIDEDIFAKTGAKRYDTKNIPNALLDLATVRVSAMIMQEKNGGLKVSLRSKNGIDVSIVAKDFNGGGHENSAGFEVADDDFEKLKNSILEKLKRII